MAVVLEGFADRKFAPLEQAMRENFADRGEIGCAVALYLDGKPVVDLWGGATVRGGVPAGPWQRDTIVRMMSVNKGVTALCAHMLADRGQLDYDRSVAFYWPEFAQAGKEALTVRTLMSGMAALVYPEHVPAGKLFDFDAMAEGLAKQAPIWPPNTHGAYHSSTYGNLVGEIIRRITGKTPGTFFRDEVALPLGLDYWFSVPASEQHRISEAMLNPGSVTYTQISAGDSTKLGRAWKPMPAAIVDNRDDPWTFDKEYPSANGRGNARAIGKLFAALSIGGTLDGVTLMSPSTIATLSTQQWYEECGLTGRKFRYGMGLFLSTPVYFDIGPGPRAFGHPGAGGALGFADPDRRLAFSYCTSFMCAGAGLGERCEALVAAVLQSLG